MCMSILSRPALLVLPAFGEHLCAACSRDAAHGAYTMPAACPPSGVSRIAPALALPRIYPPRMAAGMYIAAELSPHAALCTRSRTFAHARLSRCDFPKHTFICTSLPHLTSSS
ncbi:hypothetical protein C8J57DRAFT_1319476 [Mycena rebaudengoi]|nr:hypothetical protein C8J57DRAFT_1319476 [Mycena rebaudengoi]